VSAIFRSSSTISIFLSSAIP